jgi:putative ABC transport system permease protein
MIQSLSADLRFALRAMTRRPGVTALILLTMAIGIGAATAVFSVVESVMLRPLPYPQADRLVVARTMDAGSSLPYNTTYPELQQWRQEEVFAGVTTVARFNADLTGDGEPGRVSVMQVGAGYFDIIRMDALVGRVFLEQEHVLDGPKVALLGESFRQSRYAAGSDVIGSTVRLDDEVYEIVGIAPDQASSPAAVDVWLPFQPDPAAPGMDSWDNHAFTAIARLKDGETLASTNARLATLAAHAESEHPKLRAGETVVALGLVEFMTGSNVSRALLMLLAAVGFVVLMGCVNVANLLLSVASKRRQELAVRSALGAGRGRLVRQLLIESLVLAPIGGLLGIVISVQLVEGLVSMAPVGVPRIDEVALNLPVLAFALGVSVLVALFFGVVPAMRASSLAQAGVIKQGALATTASRGERRSRNLLVGLQLALSLTLLSGAGYTMLGLSNLQSSDLGFETDSLVQVPVSLPRARYQPGEPVIGFYERLVEEISALPAVDSATVRSASPIGGGGFYVSRSYLKEDQPEPPASVEISGPWTVVGADHFRTMGIPIHQGRGFLSSDVEDSLPVVVVNQSFAEQMFGDDSPIGKRIRSWRDENVYREVVGVVGNVRYYSVGDQIRPCVYVPHQQDRWRFMNLVVRVNGSPEAAIPELRETIARLDPELVVAGISTMDQVFTQNLAGPRFLTVLLVIFAGMALLQVGLGIYGVLSYLASLRTREIGIRYAVGAQRWDVVWMVSRDSMMVVLLGIVAGLAGVVVSGRLLQQMLFEVSMIEPLVVLVICLILAAVAALASFIPARRAAGVNPVDALRLE